MENNKNKKSVKFQGDMLNFCDFIQVFVFTRNHHLKCNKSATSNIQSNLGDSNADFSKPPDFSNLTVSPDHFGYHLM